MPQTKKYTQEQIHLLDYIVNQHERVSKPFQKFFWNRYGWGPQQLALMCYLARHQRLTLTQAAELLDISKQQMTKLAALSVERGLVDRVQDETNRRSTYLVPTEQGRVLLRDGEQEFINVFMGKLGEQDDNQRNYLIQAAKDVTEFIVNCL